MSATRRFQLLEWANKSGSWIIEDDYDSEYRYDTMPIASLQGLDVNSRVIYTGTLSKVLFPALRLGYLVIPSDLVERFAAVRQAVDICRTMLPRQSLPISLEKDISLGISEICGDFTKSDGEY
jgi:GntR family transcriptional regulator/MocR family aminotransferase